MERKENIIKDKSYKFALQVIKIYKKLISEHKEYILSKQLLKSGTSIGANIEEADGGISKKEFIAKVQISYKEAKETLYWLSLLYDSEYLSGPDFESLSEQCHEIIRILSAILKSSKQ
jgi:four helix bundle protein